MASKSTDGRPFEGLPPSSEIAVPINHYLAIIWQLANVPGHGSRSQAGRRTSYGAQPATHGSPSLHPMLAFEKGRKAGTGEQAYRGNEGKAGSAAQGAVAARENKYRTTQGSQLDHEGSLRTTNITHRVQRLALTGQREAHATSTQSATLA